MIRYWAGGEFAYFQMSLDWRRSHADFRGILPHRMHGSSPDAFVEKGGGGRSIVHPMALTKGNQRFFALLHLDPYRTGGFILLMLGVGVTGGKEFGTGFGNS